MSKLKERLKSVSPDIRDNFNNFERFIELIEGIGFVEKSLSNSLIQHQGMVTKYTYNGYTINIGIYSREQETRWSISHDKLTGEFIWLYHDVGNSEYRNNFSLDDIGLLEKHFKSELRELKLKELLN